jgi:hypothetical protein
MKKKLLFFLFLIILNFFTYSYFLSGNWKVILSSLNFIKPGHIITVDENENADSLYLKNIPFISKCVLHTIENDNVGKKYSYCRAFYLKLFGIYKKPFILCQIHFSKLYVYENEKMEIPSIILQRVDLYIFNI